ncbi:DegT/DnrJ/EryC1/StrS family aminotransferase [Nonomuraea sp. FMUSA5-5]|uniref:DegT/DnrJ/EryC1/StrS family aminotransferase n=1 Tax=Nonomuraea composti TaxID=2720023 RepID=A0ABX1BJP0_9ACTN|nr:DegT/DnrJ/EryC1/StrS family aminotransferase [Nonomuraea sp. FMUSA5-5]
MMPDEAHLTSARPAPDTLAIAGGSPVRPPNRPWPRWPQPAENAPDLLASVLAGGRWGISGPATGSEPYERAFGRRFAEYVGTRHCVPVDHGSSALVTALEALRLPYGSTVLVPALTWVASASAVFRAGLVPILVDVDPETGCVGPDNVAPEADTGALIAVHWACAMADIPGIREITDPLGITVIEDAAQAHGAQWLGKQAGSLGRIGCFSMQHSKVLTAGEGGAVVTDDDALAALLEELRADSRRYAGGQSTAMGLDLVESATLMGANFCLSEFGAAVLCAQLGILDEQHAIRNANYLLLGKLLADVPGVRLLNHREEQTRLSLYEVPLIFDPLPDGVTAQQIADALTAELHTRFYPPRAPLNRSTLLRPWTKPSLAHLAERFVAEHRARTYPHAEHLVAHTVLAHHGSFLGDERDMADIADAVAKVLIAYQ